MDFNKFFRSKIFKSVLLVIGAFIILLLVFQAGMFVGFKKASFSYKWGENYQRNFAGPRGGFFRDFKGGDFIESHGVVGQIIKIDGSSVVIKGKDNVEKIVVIKDNTVINRARDTVKPSDLKVDDFIVVIGDPNNTGQIEAKLIRLLPPSPAGGAPSGPPHSWKF